MMSRFFTPVEASDRGRLRDLADDMGERGRRMLDADRAPVVGKKGLEEQIAALVESQGVILGHTTEVLSWLTSGAQNDVLETGTRTIGAAGSITRRYQIPFAGVAIVNPSGGTLSVQEGGEVSGSAAGDTAQGDGPGSFLVPPASVIVLPLVGLAFTVVGAPGTRFSYSTLSRRPEPSGAIGGAGAVGATETASQAETSTLLAGNATVNGAARAAANFARFRAFAASDVAGTLNIQQARTAAGPWFTTTTAPVAAGFGSGTVLESIVTLPFVRAQYVNGAAAQASFEFDSSLVAI